MTTDMRKLIVGVVGATLVFLAVDAYLEWWDSFLLVLGVLLVASAEGIGIRRGKTGN
jgi:hypothetical protein